MAKCLNVMQYILDPSTGASVDLGVDFSVTIPGELVDDGYNVFFPARVFDECTPFALMDYGVSARCMLELASMGDVSCVAAYLVPDLFDTVEDARAFIEDATLTVEKLWMLHHEVPWEVGEELVDRVEAMAWLTQLKEAASRTYEADNALRQALLAAAAADNSGHGRPVT
jgi:hypothetical protein